MDNPLALAKRDILDPHGLDSGHLEKALGKMLGGAIDSGDLYFQQLYTESWSLEEGIVKQGAYHSDQGIGVRALSKERSGFAYTNELALPPLLDAVQGARAIARSQQDGSSSRCATTAIDAARYYPSDAPLNGVSVDQRITLLQQIDRRARAYHPAISQVSASLTASYELILVAAADGRLAADSRPLLRLGVSVIAEHKGRREQGFSGAGGRGSYQDIFAQAEQLADEAARQAIVALDAKDAPAGTMTVVLGPGWPGILFHEAVGHGLEGDFNRKGTSAFSGRLGQRIASPLCTVVDDGTLPNRRGSLNIDDEGTPSQCTVLIEQGRLCHYMQDRLNARLMGQSETGNGRRESYAHQPMPRMTNTYMLAGESAPEEIIASVKNGLYAVNFGGGQVDITSGKFVFSAAEAYLIKDGRIDAPVRGATLIGDGPRALQHISMVGNDLALDNGIGTCGKDGQSVPVGVGQPTLRIDGLAVGGTDT